MRSRKFINGCDLKRFKAYTVKYGCNDEESYSIMSIFFVYVASAQKVYHTMRKRDIEITSNTKQSFMNTMKSQSQCFRYRSFSQFFQRNIDSLILKTNYNTTLFEFFQIKIDSLILNTNYNIDSLTLNSIPEIMSIMFSFSLRYVNSN